MPSRRTQRQMFAAVFLSAASLLLGLVAGVEIYRWALLRNADRTVSARVTAERLNECVGRGCSDSSGPYQIKYQFNTAQGAGTTYTYTGQTLFTEEWASVSKRAWEAASSTGEVEVLYAPQNPRINQPADLEAPSPFNAFGLALIALFMAVVTGANWRGHQV
jgi:hypothetical protein